MNQESHQKRGSPKATRTNPKNKFGGFSLLETLVALAVLNAAILGPIALATSSIRSASLSHNITIASFLAEEAAELVRARREENIYADNDWLNGFDGCTAGSPCRISTDANGEISVNFCGGSCPLNYDSGVGLYWHDGGTASIFTRTFTVEEIKENKEVKVLVAVSWKERFLSGDKNVQLESRLSNWR